MQIKHTIILIVITTITLLACVLTVKLEVNKPCTFSSDNGQSSVITDKNLAQYIFDNNIEWAKIRLDHYKQDCKLTFSNNQGDNYLFWVTFKTTFALENQIVPTTIYLGKNNLFSIIFDFI